jgi:hypothetical protein
VPFVSSPEDHALTIRPSQKFLDQSSEAATPYAPRAADVRGLHTLHSLSLAGRECTDMQVMHAIYARDSLRTVDDRFEGQSKMGHDDRETMRPCPKKTSKRTSGWTLSHRVSAPDPYTSYRGAGPVSRDWLVPTRPRRAQGPRLLVHLRARLRVDLPGRSPVLPRHDERSDEELDPDGRRLWHCLNRARDEGGRGA